MDSDRYFGASAVDYRGTRYVLGRTPRSYAMWDRDGGGPALQTFPLTDEGWAVAWQAFHEAESQIPAAGGEPGWTRGEAVPVRELRATQAFVWSWRLYRTYGAGFLGVAAAMVLPAQVLAIWLGLATLRPTPPIPGVEGTGVEPALWARVVPGLLMALVVYPVVGGALARASRTAMAGNAPRIGGTYRGLGGKLASLVVVGLPLAALEGLGVAVLGTGVPTDGEAAFRVLLLLALLVLQVWVWIAFLYAPAIVALEPVGGVGALRRAWRLSAGLRARALGVLALFAAIMAVVFLTFFVFLFATSGVSLGRGEYVVTSLLGAVLGLALAPPIGISAFLLYASARVRREGAAAPELTDPG